MKPTPRTRIIDIVKIDGYEDYLYRCFTGPRRRYSRRVEYLREAIPEGFHKKLLVFNGNVVGQIEYGPPRASYYPISGQDLVVMNCIWVLRKAKGHNLGRLLVKDMVRSERHAASFATIALDNHWSPWFKRWQLENLGFKPIASITVIHKTKNQEHPFSIFLMWMPNVSEAKPPTWNQEKLLEGITFCTAHPLYRPKTYRSTQILKRQ